MKHSYLPISLYIGQVIVYSLLVVAVLWLVLPFLPAILFAGVTALLFHELAPYFPKVVRSRSWLYASVAVLLTVLLCIIPLALFVVLLGMEAFRFIEFLRQLVENGTYVQLQEVLFAQQLHWNQWLAQYGLSLPLDKIGPMALGALEQGGRMLYGNAAYSIANITSLFLQGVFYLIIAFFLIKDREVLAPLLSRMLPFNTHTNTNLLHSLEHVSKTILLGTILSAILLGTAMTGIFWLWNLPSPLLWGLAVGFLSLIPVVGTWIVYVPAILIVVFSQAWWIAGLLIITIIAVEHVLFGAVVRPYLIEDRTGLYPLAILISFIGGVQHFGPMGIFYGPLIMTLFLTLTTYLLERRAEGEV